MEVETDITREINNTNSLDNLDSACFYSLSKELERRLTELARLEKKIILENTLLSQTNNQRLISNLQKKNQESEKQKIELNIVIKKLEHITNSIKDFTLFFIFIRRFYVLAIQKENFENKKNDVSVKLISSLIAEEETLYHEYIDGDCFSKILKALSFEPYQECFQNYVQNFFDSIQTSTDCYTNSLLILTAVFQEFSHINNNYFNLTMFKLFLSENIPADVALPKTSYELVALRFFFYYEILNRYLQLRSVKTNFYALKQSINLELKLTNFKASLKKKFIEELYDLKKALSKIEKKLTDFLEASSVQNKEEDINAALAFYKEIESELQTLNKKNNNLIDCKYKNEIKMLRLLAILDNESYLPKFLELFNKKIGSNVFLIKSKKNIYIQTNREALTYLFHAICRDNYYTPHESFIKKMTKDYCNDDISLLENITLEELMEFSYFYIFSMIYTDFYVELIKLNNKINYLKIVIHNRLVNIKLDRLELLEKRKDDEINNFFKKIFKNIEEYYQFKKNTLEEIKLCLEVIQDIKYILLDIQSWETTFTPKLISEVPMPDKNFSIDQFNYLEKKLKCCKLEYQKIEKHKFIIKNKAKKSKTTEVETNLDFEEHYKLIEDLFKLLNCLSENLAFSLKYLTEESKDVNLFRQKILSAVGQIASSIEKLSSRLNTWKSEKQMLDLSKLSLPKLLAIINEFLIENFSVKGKKNYKKRLSECKKLTNKSILTVDLIINQIEIIVTEHENFNTKMQGILTLLSNSFTEESMTNFFLKPICKKVDFQINKELSKEYFFLKEKFQCLEKLIKSIKCDSDDRMIKLYSIILETENYQKIHKILKEKIFFSKKTSIKNIDSISSTSKASIEKNCLRQNKDTFHLKQLIQESKTSTSEDLNHEDLSAVMPVSVNAETENLDLNEASIKNQIEKKLTVKNNSIVFPGQEQAEKFYLDNNLLKDYENWNLEFEKWKNKKQAHIYKLFYIIESCSSIVLKTSSNAFLKYLLLYHNEFSAKNSELKKYKSQLLHYFQDAAKYSLMQTYLNQHQQWFDECFQRIDSSRALLLQDAHNFFTQEPYPLTSSFADNRAEFNKLLIFYLSTTRNYNKLRDELINEENKLNNLNRTFVSQAFQLMSLNEVSYEDTVLSDFSIQLDKVGQLKLTIEQEFEAKQQIKKKLFLLANPSIVNFYLSRIDPCDAFNLEASKNYSSTSFFLSVLPQEGSIGTVPTDNYYKPFPVAVYTRL